jgi:single-stranded-DNA-specific exonuclease
MDLSGITTDLAGALETLAPFGPGNEKLTLATRGLSLRSATLIGRNKEHQKLIVSDESGNNQTVLWWGGAGEQIPQGKFDLAYTVRASDWRGSQQVQMEFVDFRVVENPEIEIKSPPRRIIDFRNVSDPLTLLAEFQAQPSTLVWAEAEAKKDTGGKDRNELEHADNLVIWTTPPSHRELEIALDIVKPGIITLVCAHRLQKSIDGYLARLAGLLKFAITRKAGKVTYAALAAATAERVITVDLGLKWLISTGKIILVNQDEDQLWVAPGKTVNDLGSAALLRVEIQELLEESAAYRVFFHQADKKTLFP